MFLKTLMCVSVAWITTTLFAQSITIPQLWNDTTQRYYNDVLSADKTLRMPWSIDATQILQKVQQGTVTDNELEQLLNTYEKEQTPVRECAEAILLLYTLRDNRKDEFLKDYTLFQEDFPRSDYTSLLSPQKHLRKCPKCKGKSAQKINCKSCKGTKVCTTCKGKGVHVLGGMRRTKRRYTSPSYSDNVNFSRNSSDGSSRRKLTSHTTSNYRSTSYVKEFSADTTETPCITCHGVGTCVTCTQTQKGRQCITCNSSGYIPDDSVIKTTLNNVVTKGIQIISNIPSEERLIWETSNSFKIKFEELRTECDTFKLRERVNALLSQYPKAIQRKSSERFLSYLTTLQAAQEEAISKLSSEQKKIEAETLALKKAIQEAETTHQSYYRRKEYLLRLTDRFPKANNHAELKIAIRLCEDEIQRQEDELRNALRLLETLEDFNVGIQRANQLLEQIDPVSPLQNAISTIREDFIARKKKADRHRQYLYVGIGIVILLLVYFLFDILYGIYQTNKLRR